MPLCHKHRLAFIGIPKNASTSISFALQNNTDHNMHSHETYLEMMSHEDHELCMKYTSFAVVRNPFDRLVSSYFQTRRRSANVPETFREFVLRLRPIDMNDIVLRPQWAFITLKGIILVDRILRYETLHQDWEALASEMNRDLDDEMHMSTVLPHENHSDRQRLLSVYYEDKDIIQKAYRLYKRDFELFKYEASIKDQQGSIIWEAE